MTHEKVEKLSPLGPRHYGECPICQSMNQIKFKSIIPHESRIISLWSCRCGAELIFIIHSDNGSLSTTWAPLVP